MDTTRDAPVQDDQTLDIGVSRHLSIRDAAVYAGVSDKTIRRWIQRGHLAAKKIGGQYEIDQSHLDIAMVDQRLDRSSLGVQSQRLDMRQDLTNVQPLRVDTGQNNVYPGVQASIDIRPLVEHIATLEGKVQQLTEAATTWQIRAFHLEEQLKQLTAGPSEPEHGTMPYDASPEATGASDAGAMTPDAVHSRSRVNDAVRWLFGRSR